MRNKIFIMFLLLSTYVYASQLNEAQQASERGDFKKAVEILDPLAKAGDVDALGNLGNMYAFGQGVPQDLTKAAELWKKAADKGLGTAMGNLAKLYSEGLGGLPKDQKLATQWLKKAAEHRHAPSMIQLSVLYHDGKVLDKNIVEAIAWSGLTATNTNNPALKNAAIKQIKQWGSEASPEQMSEAQKRSDELVKIIDSNIKKYKSGT